MKVVSIILSFYFGTCACALSQSSGATSAGSSTGATGGIASGSTLWNGATISGTGGSPGPNSANALSHGTTANNLGAPTTGGAGAAAPASHGNAVDPPAANRAAESLGNTDAGVLKNSCSPSDVRSAARTANRSSPRGTGKCSVGVVETSHLHLPFLFSPDSTRRRMTRALN